MTNLEKIQLCQEIVNQIQEQSKRPACYLEFSKEPFGIADSHLGGFGALNILIRPKDLKNRDFSQVLGYWATS